MSEAPVAGLVLVDKPAGISSFSAIARLRPAYGRKLGHTGTLDPFATGLLVVLHGRASRLAPYLGGLDKRYRATVQFGVTSTTDDPEGELTSTGGTTDLAALTAALPAFRGTLTQVPPAASAVPSASRASSVASANVASAVSNLSSFHCSKFEPLGEKLAAAK